MSWDGVVLGAPAKRAKSLRAVLAAGAARVRAERGLSEEDGAELLRSYGLVGWQVGTLTQVEAGVRPLAVEELLLLCAAYRVSVAELAGSDPDEVELAAGARLPAAAVRALLADGGEEVRALPDDALDVPATRPVTTIPDALVDSAARLGVRGPVEVGRALAAIGEAERNAARRLGVSPERLVLAAVGRWGKPFTAERDARIALRRSTTEPDRHITLRGLVTRELLAELEDHLGRPVRAP
jgi:transcriptional regulator with XRE-family HTH domain